MSHPRGPAGLLLGALACCFATPALAEDSAAAPSKDVVVCADAFEQAQVLRDQAKYIAALQQALQCSQPTCGAALFSECSKLYVELQEAVPTVVISANAGDGEDVPGAQLAIDGTIKVEQFDGRPIKLDPGSHQFEFNAPGMVPIVKHVTLLAGERFRQVTARFSPARAAATPSAPVPTTSPNPAAAPKPTASRVPLASYVLGGVSLLAAGGFVAFQVKGSNAYDDLKRGCSPRCSEEEISSAKRNYTLSYGAIGVSAAALAASVGFYLLRPSSTSPGAALSVTPSPEGASARLTTSF